MSDMVDVTPVMWHKSIIIVAVMALSSFFVSYCYNSLMWAFVKGPIVGKTHFIIYIYFKQ